MKTTVIRVFQGFEKKKNAAANDEKKVRHVTLPMEAPYIA